MAEGKLVVNAKKQIRVRFTNSKGREVEMAVPEAEISSSLKREPVEKLNGRDVELDEEKGQPRRVRPVGEAFAAVRPPQPAGQQREPRGDRPRQGGGGRPGPQERKKPQQRGEDRSFHNPYNFVPAPPRKTDHAALGDHAPAGHHRYHADRVSGVIRVTMTLATPLLLPDAARAREHEHDNPALGIQKGHKDFPVRLDADGKPYLAPTSVKGMLRSAYEAVTNSRLAVFAGHEDRLGRRMVANEGLGLVPCRVEGAGIRLLPGTSTITAARPTGPMYAAWLPSNLLVGPHRSPFVPNHRDAVSCWVELWERTPWNKRESRFEHHNKFQYWKVLSVGQTGGTLPPPPASAPLPQRPGSNHHTPVPGASLQPINGFACITGYNFDRKYNERVFFEEPGVPLSPRGPDHDRLWRNLISDYRTNQDLQQGRPRPGALQRAGWSRHMTDDSERELSEGTLAYALVERGGASWRVLELFPVSIARRLFAASPEGLLDEPLLPAYWIDRLSPADRVFGWVRQTDDRRKNERPGVDARTAAIKAYRGNIRVGPVTCASSDAIEWFGEPGVPLAILGQPKPQQARFYVAGSPGGEAQEAGLSKETSGYERGKGLRGRKVYPHHRGLPARHWDDPLTDRTQQSQERHFQEYRHPQLNGQEQRDNQNRSVHGWVKPGTTFTFDLHVTNLSRVELGALLWLLSLPPDHFHRLGGGKPLGFGSVRLDIVADETKLDDGDRWREFYGTLDSSAPAALDRQAAIDQFKDAVASAYGNGAAFVQALFIAAFLCMAKGFDDSRPTHYPRARQSGQTNLVPPHPEGQAYEWFVANDRTGAQGGPRVSLSDLATDQGLPMLDAP